MTVLLTLVSLVAPAALGWCMTSFGWVAKASRPRLLLRLSLSVGLGFGFTSIGFFLWTLIFGPSRPSFVAVELILVLALSAILVLKAKRREPATFVGARSLPFPRTALAYVLAGSFLLASLAALGAFVLLTRNRPEGGFDAWAQWNMHARILFRAGADWVAVYGPILRAGRIEYVHSDYPLLLASSIARCWTYIGHESLTIPALVAMAFTFGTVGLVASSLSDLRGLNQGLLGGIILLGTPFFISHGASQYADIPLGFFLLATLVLFSLYGRSNENARLLVLAGLFAGLAAWTKNEGTTFVLVIIVSRFVGVVPRQGLKRYITELLAFGRGLLPVLLVIALFKTQTTANDLVSAEGSMAKLHHLMEPSRYSLIVWWFKYEILEAGFGRWIINLLPILPFYLLLTGWSREEEDRPALLTAACTLCLMMSGYFLVYLLSPEFSETLEHRLTYSVDRLFLQLWPSVIFSMLLLANPPGHVAHYARGKEFGQSGEFRRPSRG